MSFRPQAATAGVAEGEALLGAAEVLDGPPALPGEQEYRAGSVPERGVDV